MRSLAEGHIVGPYLKVLLSCYTVECEVKMTSYYNVIGSGLQVIAHDFVAIAVLDKFGAFNGRDLLGLDVGQRGDCIAEDSVLQVGGYLKGNHRGGDNGNRVITVARC